MKEFEFNNRNCGLLIGHYNKENAMCISVVDLETDEVIQGLTVLDKDFDYDIGLVTVEADIVDGDEIWGYKTGTDILKELGVVEKVWESHEFNDGTANIVKADICIINLEKLKEYSTEWNYWETELEED